MRKLKLQMQMTLDGYVSAGPNDEQLWVTWAWEQIRPHVLKLADSSDTILIGRKLAVDYIPYWEDVKTQPDNPMHEVSTRVTSLHKVVFTQTMTESIWPNTSIATGDIVDEVNKLKQQPGKDIIVYGGTSFVAALVKAGLIDEYHFFINPVAIGKGEGIFDKLDGFLQLELMSSQVYDSGIVLLIYEPK